jgi:serine/threonine protein phosphatase PrpC
MSMSDERAVEFGQFSQAGQMQPQTELTGYYEPAQIADLTRQGRLLVVADGGGGAAAGETAGRYAVQKILHDFYHSREPDLEKRLLEVIRQTNTAIFERNRRFPDRRPIATTVLAALIHQNKLLVASVGDGRAYVVWDQDIEHLTGDNSSSPQRQAREAEAAALDAPPGENDKPAESAAEEQKPASSDPAEGDALARTSAEEAKSRLLAEKEQPSLTLSPTTPSPAQPSNLPTFEPKAPYGQPPSPFPCSLGLAEQVKIDLFSRRLFAGDMVVLCGGGLTGYVTEKEIAETATQNPPDLASRRLIDMAAKRGCRDTLAVSMARVLAKPLTQAAPARQTLPLAPDWDTLTKSSTRPLPAITARPLIPSQTPPQQRRWPIYAAAAIALLLFSLVGFWAGGYWLVPPSAPVESVPSSGNTTLDSNKEPALTQEAVAGAASGQTSPVATAQSANAAQAPSLTPAGTPVVENNSPLPTPTEVTNVRAGDVITPTPVRPQPTPLPTIALPAGCENKGRFAGDVTVEDGTEFAPGEPFEKVWSVSNYGTCSWGGGYMVRFTEGDLMGAPEQVPLIEVVEPEATGLITIPMVAPDLPGTYRGSWQMIGLDGELFGPELYLEIKVVPGILKVDEASATTLYDFVTEAAQAQWSAGDVTYQVVTAPVDRDLVIPDPQGIVVVGPAELRGDTISPGNILMTHPHLELGLIEGTYQVDTPLQPTDAIIGSLGLPKAAAINDDGVTFELSFKPSDGPDQLLFSKSVKYEDTPVSVRQALTTLQPGQTGAFTLRVKGGNSLSYDWATWIELRLVRP